MDEPPVGPIRKEFMNKKLENEIWRQSIAVCFLLKISSFHELELFWFSSPHAAHGGFKVFRENPCAVISGLCLWFFLHSAVNHEPLVRFNVLMLARNVIEVLADLLAVAEQLESPFVAVSDVKIKLSSFGHTINDSHRSSFRDNPMGQRKNGSNCFMEKVLEDGLFWIFVAL